MFTSPSPTLSAAMTSATASSSTTSLSYLGPITKKASDVISLTAKENEIFGLLRECLELNSLKDVTLRVAGGWVRDKLLGLSSMDCDIAIDTMMGERFALLFLDFLRKRGIPTSSYGVIHANPTKSKHLETATLSLLGYPLDFVNLRSEEYSTTSRIPNQVTFGTPYEDAMRRDFTVNSLFLNLNTSLLEDWTRFGFEDLEDGLMRTPLPAQQTLVDDPLRILRGIRFATRFAFRLHSDFTTTIVGCPIIGRLFMEKISRERVGDEIGKILSDKRHALQGLEMVRDLGIADLIFRVPGFGLGGSDVSDKLLRESIPKSKDYISSLEAIIDDPKSKRLDEEERKIILLASSMLDHHSLTVDVGKGKKDYYPRMICRDGLKLTNSLTNDVVKVLKGCSGWIDIISDGHSDIRTSKALSLKIGRLIRMIGKNWTLSLYLACIISKESINKAVHFDLEKKVRKLGLQDCHQWNHVINGDRINSIIGLKEGRRCGELLSLIMDLQITSSNNLSTEEAIAFVENNK